MISELLVLGLVGTALALQDRSSGSECTLKQQTKTSSALMPPATSSASSYSSPSYCDCNGTKFDAIMIKDEDTGKSVPTCPGIVGQELKDDQQSSSATASSTASSSGSGSGPSSTADSSDFGSGYGSYQSGGSGSGVYGSTTSTRLGDGASLSTSSFGIGDSMVSSSASDLGDGFEATSTSGFGATSTSGFGATRTSGFGTHSTSGLSGDSAISTSGVGDDFAFGTTTDSGSGSWPTATSSHHGESEFASMAGLLKVVESAVVQYEETKDSGSATSQSSHTRSHRLGYGSYASGGYETASSGQSQQNSSVVLNGRRPGWMPSVATTGSASGPSPVGSIITATATSRQTVDGGSAASTSSSSASHAITNGAHAFGSDQEYAWHLVGLGAAFAML